MRVYGVGNGQQQVGTALTYDMRKTYTLGLAGVSKLTPPEYFNFWNRQTLDAQDQMLTPAEYDALVRSDTASAAYQRWLANPNVAGVGTYSAGLPQATNWLPIVLLGLGVWWLFRARR